MKTIYKRIIMSVLGVFIGGVSVAIFKTAAFGVDPFQTFMAGFDKLIPIKFGTLYVIANAVLLLFALIFDRHYINLATFINLFILGYVTQFTYDLIQKILPETGFVVRIICLIAGIVIICFGSALYMTADLGVSTYDAVALIISNTWKKGQFKYIRIATDIVCVILGVILFVLAGGIIRDIPTIAGVGTIITAFFMGPLIEFFNEYVARPFLEEKKKES